MNKLLWLASLGTLTMVLSSCGSDRPSSQSSPTSSPQPVAQAPQGFPKPTIPQTSPMSTVAVKGLLQPTNSQARLSQIAANRKRDPFAALVPAELRFSTKSTSATSSATRPANVPSSVSQPAKPSVKLPAPPQTIASRQLPIPSLPPLPTTSMSPNSLPALPASQTSLADAVEITGVVQVKGEVTAIVQSPDEATARYVRTGDYLANGRVLLKRIIMSKSGEPTIVLQQNGIEVTKSIGSTRGPIASAL